MAWEQEGLCNGVIIITLTQTLSENLAMQGIMVDFQHIKKCCEGFWWNSKAQVIFFKKMFIDIKFIEKGTVTWATEWYLVCMQCCTTVTSIYFFIGTVWIYIMSIWVMGNLYVYMIHLDSYFYFQSGYLPLPSLPLLIYKILIPFCCFLSFFSFTFLPFTLIPPTFPFLLNNFFPILQYFLYVLVLIYTLSFSIENVIFTHASDCFT